MERVKDRRGGRVRERKGKEKERSVEKWTSTRKERKREGERVCVLGGGGGGRKERGG